MTTAATPGNSNAGFIKLFGIITFIVLVAGAIASLGFMFYNGRQNKSILLMLLFAGWVFAPFLALGWANLRSLSWVVTRRVTLYSLSFFITLVSLVGYSGLWSPPGAKPAFVFLMIPLCSWMLMGIVIPVTIALLRRGARQREKV